MPKSAGLIISYVAGFARIALAGYYQRPPAKKGVGVSTVNTSLVRKSTKARDRVVLKFISHKSTSNGSTYKWNMLRWY